MQKRSTAVRHSIFCPNLITLHLWNVTINCVGITAQSLMSVQFNRERPPRQSGPKEAGWILHTWHRSPLKFSTRSWINKPQYTSLVSYLRRCRPAMLRLLLTTRAAEKLLSLDPNLMRGFKSVSSPVTDNKLASPACAEWKTATLVLSQGITNSSQSTTTFSF